MRVFELDSEVLFEESRTIEVASRTVEEVLTVPQIRPERGNAYFVDARLRDSEGKQLVSSLYWLSAKEDVLDWDESLWFVTPMAEYADLTGIAEMPQVELEVEHQFTPTADGHELQVSLSNPGDNLAFFVELRVHGEDSGQLTAPVLWSDNYVSLMPGEALEVTASIPAHALGGEAPVFRYSGINVPGS